MSGLLGMGVRASTASLAAVAALHDPSLLLALQAAQSSRVPPAGQTGEADERPCSEDLRPAR